MTSLFEAPDRPASSAKLSACGLYRYELRRRWQLTFSCTCDVPFGKHDPPCPERPFCVIGLNPSIADATQDDPTIRRCIAFAKREGCGELVMLNLYALRATDPGDLLLRGFLGRPNDRTETIDLRPAVAVAESSVGPENNHTIAAVLVEVANRGGVVVAAWGSTDAKLHAPRVAVVRKLIGTLPVMCFGVTKDGSPRHPLYLRADAPLVPWSTQ